MSKTDKELAVELTVAWLNYNSSLVSPIANGVGGGSQVRTMKPDSISLTYLHFLNVLENRKLPRTDK